MARILVVEDDEHIADGLRFNLELEDHVVTLADDEAEANPEKIKTAPETAKHAP